VALRVLCIDDDVRLYELLAAYLEPNGVTLVHAADGPKGLAALGADVFDAVLLDVMMPGMDGLTVCRRIRETSRVPIIMLTARGDEADRVVGLELGADDYLTKPFHPQELVARAKALLRRTRLEPDQPEVIRAGRLEIDLGRHEVRHGENRIQLRPKEFDLLALLARHPGRVYQRTELLDLVWGYDFPGYTRTVDVHVQQVREKLAAAGVSDPSIDTVWGVGYRLELKAA
jgi:DNA-binding response OmpR family regulator